MYIRFQQIMAFFPVFSTSDIEKAFPIFDKKALVYWQKKHYLTKIRNGYYFFNSTQIEESFLFFTANKIYNPSYISFECALSFYGIIPEGVFMMTSATSLKTAIFNTPNGKFQYKKIKSNLFFGYKIINLDKYSFKIAELEKVILDMLYLNESLDSIESFESLRWNKEELKKINFEKLSNYQLLFYSNALNKRVNHLMKYIYA